MTAGKLAALLRGFDPDMPILVFGYEGGYDDPATPAVIEVFDDQGPARDSWWMGRYDDADCAGDKPTFKAVVIGR